MCAHNKTGEKKSTLLLHTCCAPCSSAVLERLQELFTVTLLFYNPNIFPQEEHERRKNELVDFLSAFQAKKRDLREIPYEPQEFYRVSNGLENERERGKRCFACYELRLAKTAEYANREGFDYFTTALSISPHKDAQKINEIGQKIAAEYEKSRTSDKKSQFLCADFKKENGYKRSLELSAQYGLYRQNYCGCEFSRFNKKGSSQN